MALRALFDLPAPAKINAFLHLVGRRADGYHLIESVFVLIDWADTLHVERRDDGRLQRHDLGAALPADDLCLRAARALQQTSGTPLGADISIDKRVPWGAGLGGGSSDAATTLLALNHLWALRWPRQRLLSLAAGLGADVPFFVGGRNAFVQGIGERLTPIVWPASRYEVLKPAAALATPAVFGHPARLVAPAAAILAGSFADDQQGLIERIAARQSAWQQGAGSNHLQPAAEQLCPEVAQAARLLEARHGNSRMTGSGSAVFARVPAAAEDGAAGAPLATGPVGSLPSGWVSRMCRSLDQHPLADWAG